MLSTSDKRLHYSIYCQFPLTKAINTEMNGASNDRERERHAD